VAIFFTLFQHLPLLFRINTNKMRYILVLVSSFMLWTSCSQGPSSEVSTEEQKIKIVCTTSIMTDWVSNVVSSDFEVVPLLKKGIDPHVYKPAKKDLDLLRAADVIIYHGVHLEGKIIEVLEKLEGKVIINAAEDFTAEEIISDPNFPASQDPHYWFDTELVKKSLQTIVREIAEVYPQHNKAMSAKAATYAATIEFLLP
jgi:manganese/zinc/iron transport system substrate-binding protein